MHRWANTADLGSNLNKEAELTLVYTLQMLTVQARKIPTWKDKPVLSNSTSTNSKY